jgi:plasmid stabilization system protein ParE
MSSPERCTLRLSRQAERDIENILQYTHETYGERQRQIYADALHKALETITGNPGLGHGRPDLSSATGPSMSNSISWYIRYPAGP